MPRLLEGFYSRTWKFPQSQRLRDCKVWQSKCHFIWRILPQWEKEEATHSEWKSSTLRRPAPRWVLDPTGQWGSSLNKEFRLHLLSEASSMGQVPFSILLYLASGLVDWRYMILKEFNWERKSKWTRNVEDTYNTWQIGSLDPQGRGKSSHWVKEIPKASLVEVRLKIATDIRQMQREGIEGWASPASGNEDTKAVRRVSMTAVRTKGAGHLGFGQWCGSN